MADGKTHYNWWLRFIPFFMGVSVLVMLVSFWFGISILAGYLLGAILEPDLDHISITSSEGRAMRKFGVFGVLWVMYWFPYAYIFPHRSFFSHFPFVSTVIRLLYVSMPITILSYGFGYFNWTNIAYAFPVICGIVTGLTLSDAIHFVLDTKIYKIVGKVFL